MPAHRPYDITRFWPPRGQRMNHRLIDIGWARFGVDHTCALHPLEIRPIGSRLAAGIATNALSAACWLPDKMGVLIARLDTGDVHFPRSQFLANRDSDIASMAYFDAL